MAAVGQLNQNNAHIVGHSQQHFAERLSLIFLPAAKTQLIELGKPIYQLGNVVAKLLGQIGFGYAAIFHRIVQQGRHKRLHIKPPLGTLGSYGNGVGNVRLATFAHLPQVRCISHFIGGVHFLDIITLQIIELAKQGGKTGGRSGCGGRL